MFVNTLYCKNSDAQNVDECRYNMFSSGYPVEKLPPTSVALAEHTRRAMYQSEIWKSCLTKNQNRPSPLDWGWAFNDSEELIPFWSSARQQHQFTKLFITVTANPHVVFDVHVKKKYLKCTGLCSCNFETCNSENISSSQHQREDTARNVFDFLESLT